MKRTALKRLMVSENGHYLIWENGVPFFYLADTAWELIHKLTLEEAEYYFAERVSKGFTVIQTVVLAERDGLRVPNVYGDLPLTDMDPEKPNEAYFRHVDRIIELANSLGLYLGLLPTWGDKVRQAWGIGPEIFNADNARAYGKFLGNRYRDAGLVWILGGDRSPRGYEAVWSEMAVGLREGDGGTHLITAHGAEGEELRSSSCFFGDKEWLGINMCYSGHRWGFPTHQWISQDYQLNPPKPVFDGEPRYENHPYIDDNVSYYHAREIWDGVTRANSFQVRQAAYWAVFAGSCGHTYGCNDVWQIYRKGDDPRSEANTYWNRALKFFGSTQMGYIRRLVEVRPWYRFVPDNSWIMEGQKPEQDHIQAVRDLEDTFLLAYVPSHRELQIDTSQITNAELRVSWFNPRNGSVPVTQKRRKQPRLRVTPPTEGDYNDWVLVVDSAELRALSEELSELRPPEPFSEL